MGGRSGERGWVDVHIGAGDEDLANPSVCGGVVEVGSAVNRDSGERSVVLGQDLEYCDTFSKVLVGEV